MTKAVATAMKTRTAVSLTKTTPVLKFADSLIPMMRRVVTAKHGKEGNQVKLRGGRRQTHHFARCSKLSVLIGAQRPSYMIHFAPGTSQI